MRHTILLIDHAPAIGGAEASLLLLLSHLDRQQWDPHLVSVEGCLADAASGLGVPVHHVEMPRLRRSPRFPVDWMETASALAQVARRIDAALLHANTVRAALFTAPAAQMTRRPYVWHMRDFWLSESRPRRLWPDRAGKRLLCRAAQVVIANSHAVANQLPCSTKTVVVHNGIDLSLFDPELSGADFRSRYNIPADAALVGMVGRLRPWKGQMRFLHMAAAVAQKRTDAHFVVVGGDPFQVNDDYARALTRLCRDLELHRRVHFTGHLDDVRPALAAMDVFVHPGDPEPFGLVNLEAMAMGKPVVAFAHGTLPEIVISGETGILVPPGDLAGLAQGVAPLLEEKRRAQCMGRAGRQRVTQRFDIRLTTHRIEDTYRHLLR